MRNSRRCIWSCGPSHPTSYCGIFPRSKAQPWSGIFAEDVDADSLLAATRLEGVFEPIENTDSGPTTVYGNPEPEPIRRENQPERQRLLEQADDAEAKGNLVRAAILRTMAEATEASAQTVERLVGHLQKTLDFPGDEAAAWRHGLTALLEPAASGVWPIEARLLFDLQNICVDHESPVYAADLVEWIVSWGRKPVKRLLPYQGDVLAVKHLRLAVHRLSSGASTNAAPRVGTLSAMTRCTMPRTICANACGR